MIDKERDAVKMLVLMNAIEFLGAGCPPTNDELQIDFVSVMMDMKSLLESNNPRAICAGGIAGYYTDSLESGTPAARAEFDYPDMYRDLENAFLGNEHIVNFLSAVADCYQGDGESTIHDRLLAKNAYVTSSPGKERARRSLSNTPRKRGFWSAIFGSMVFVLCLVNIGCGPSEPSNSEIAAGMKKSFIRETGAYSSNLDAKAKKIGDGRWAVEMTVEKNGYKRALNATAVMDKHGDIHYHTR